MKKLLLIIGAIALGVLSLTKAKPVVEDLACLQIPDPRLLMDSIWLGIISFSCITATRILTRVPSRSLLRVTLFGCFLSILKASGFLVLLTLFIIRGREVTTGQGVEAVFFAVISILLLTVARKHMRLAWVRFGPGGSGPFAPA